jgi:SAM-dependent methyltransferase
MVREAPFRPGTVGSPMRPPAEHVHLVRYQMYRDLEQRLRRIAPTGVGLAVADWNPVLSRFMPDVAFRNLEYPEHDIQDLKAIADESVDVLYHEMILEHIEDPQAAVDESLRVLKKGGIAILTTVFIMPYHPSPIDLMRFSPDYLKRMHSRFSRVDAGGSGNWRTLALLLCRMTRIPVRYPSRGIFPWLLKGNNPKYPVCTWVVAQK